MMFKCAKCKSNDRFELAFSPDYKGKCIIQKTLNEKGHIVISVDGYVFTPDLRFMNEHAVCSYCGAIKHWEYAFAENEEP